MEYYLDFIVHTSVTVIEKELRAKLVVKANVRCCRSIISASTQDEYYDLSDHHFIWTQNKLMIRKTVTLVLREMDNDD